MPASLRSGKTSALNQVHHALRKGNADPRLVETLLHQFGEAEGYRPEILGRDPHPQRQIDRAVPQSSDDYHRLGVVHNALDRKRDVSGKSVTVREKRGVSSILKKKKTRTQKKK